MRAIQFWAAAQNHQKVKVSQTSFNLSVILTRKTNRTTFRVYFCLELDGDTITQMVTINLPAEWQTQRERDRFKDKLQRETGPQRERDVYRNWQYRETHRYREMGIERDRVQRGRDRGPVHRHMKSSSELLPTDSKTHWLWTMTSGPLMDSVTTFVQLAVDVLWELGAGFHVGGVNIECLTMGSSPLPLLHGLSAHAQYGATEVLNLRVLHHLKLTDWHPNGKPWKHGWF